MQEGGRSGVAEYHLLLFVTRALSKVRLGWLSPHKQGGEVANPGTEHCLDLFPYCKHTTKEMAVDYFPVRRFHW